MAPGEVVAVALMPFYQLSKTVTRILGQVRNLER